MYYLGEWFLSVWVTDDISQDESDRLGDEIEAVLRAWAAHLPESLASRITIYRTEVGQ